MIGTTTGEVIALIVSFLSKYATKKDLDDLDKIIEEIQKHLTDLDAKSNIIQGNTITKGRKTAGKYVNLPIVDGKQIGYMSNTFTLVVCADGKVLSNGYEYEEVEGGKSNRIKLLTTFPRGTNFHFIIHGWVLADIPPEDEDVENTNIFGDTETEQALECFGTVLLDDGTTVEVELMLDGTIR